MHQKDKKRFATMIAGLAEVFSPEGSGPSSVGMEIYFKALQDLDIEDIERACGEITQGRVFNGLPKPAEIRQAVQGAPGTAVALAWKEVEGAVRSHGPYASVAFEDPVIHAVIEFFGGWPEFQNVTLEEWEWRRVNFERKYLDLSKAKGLKAPAHLPGQVEIENTGRGRLDAIPPPVKIGGGKKPALRLVEKIGSDAGGGR